MSGEQTGKETVFEAVQVTGYVSNMLAVGLTDYCAEEEEKLLEVVLGRRPDGIVLTGTLHTDSSRLRLAQSGIQGVEAWDLSEEPLDMLVGFSYEGLGKATAVHLLAKGYKRFSVITIPTEPWVEHFEWLELLFNERLQTREGRMLVPTRPGLGFP